MPKWPVKVLTTRFWAAYGERLDADINEPEAKYRLAFHVPKKLQPYAYFFPDVDFMSTGIEVVPLAWDQQLSCPQYLQARKGHAMSTRSRCTLHVGLVLGVSKLVYSCQTLIVTGITGSD